MQSLLDHKGTGDTRKNRVVEVQIIEMVRKQEAEIRKGGRSRLLDSANFRRAEALIAKGHTVREVAAIIEAPATLLTLVEANAKECIVGHGRGMTDVRKAVRS